MEMQIKLCMRLSAGGDALQLQGLPRQGAHGGILDAEF